MHHSWRGFPEGRARVLVTGVGGSVGQGILKALTAARLASWTVGTDCQPASAGLYAVDRGYVVPRAETPRFADDLCAIIETERIDLILVGADEEITHLSRLRNTIEARTGAIVLVGDPEAVECGHDKWLTAQWFARNGLSHPATVRADDWPGITRLVDRGGRLIIKPRWGFASVGICVPSTSAELDAAATRYGENGIVQEYVGSDDQEFTGAVLCDRAGRVGASIVLKRELRQGASYRIQPVEDTALSSALETWATRLAMRGPVNFQFRSTSNGPVCFEINPRFSGTTGVRYLFGYNDVAMAIRHFLFNERIERPLILPGVVMRLWDEMHLPGADLKSILATTVVEDGSPQTRA